LYKIFFFLFFRKFQFFYKKFRIFPTFSTTKNRWERSEEFKLKNTPTFSHPKFSFPPIVLDGKKWERSESHLISGGLRGAEEVDEAEDYEAPGSNPGKEL
jgi:hypothetical protein